MEKPIDIILMTQLKFPLPEQQSEVEAFLDSLWSMPLNVGAAQLARAILVLTDGDINEVRKIAASGFYGDPRDLIMIARSKTGLETNNYFNGPFTELELQGATKTSIMETPKVKTHFAPELHIPNGTIDIPFYLNFGATEHFILRNDDGSIHVAELEVDGAVFHLHELTSSLNSLEPASAGGVTTVIGLFVDDVQAVFDRGISAGAEIVNPVTDHEYGYRQGMFKDPFGHYWQIQKVLPAE